jgi:WD40 repeat protein
MPHCRQPLRALILGTCVALGHLPALTAAQPAGWEARAQLKVPGREIGQLALSPDGRTLAVLGDPDGADAAVVLHLWDLSGGEPALRFQGVAHKEGPARILFHRDGKTLVSVGTDGKVKRWDVSSSKPVGEFVTVQANMDLRGIAGAWLTGPTLAVGLTEQFVGLGQPPPGGVVFWDLQTGKPGKRLSLPSPQKPVAVSADGKTVVSAMGVTMDPLLIKGPTVWLLRFWDVAAGRPGGAFRVPDLSGARLSPDGKHLIVQRFEEQAGRPSLILYDLAARKANGPADAALKSSFAFDLSGDGKFLVTAPPDRKSVVVWELAVEKAVGDVGPIPSGVRKAALDNNGRTLAVANRENVVRVWSRKGP